MIITQQQSIQREANRARQLYTERVRPQLTRADKGKFITINADTGEYEIDADEMAAGDRAYDRFGENAPMVTFRVGYKSAHTIGVTAKDNELENW